MGAMTLWAPSGYVVMMVDTRWTHVDTKVDTKIVPGLEIVPDKS